MYGKYELTWQTLIHDYVLRNTKLLTQTSVSVSHDLSPVFQNCEEDKVKINTKRHSLGPVCKRIYVHELCTHCLPAEEGVHLTCYNLSAQFSVWNIEGAQWKLLDTKMFKCSRPVETLQKDNMTYEHDLVIFRKTKKAIYSPLPLQCILYISLLPSLLHLQ